MEIKIGRLDESCKEYGIVQAQLLYQGKPSGYKAIIKDGALVAIVSTEYKTLPNDIAIEVANSVAKEIGAEPFKCKYWGGKHIAFNKTGTRMYATFIVPKGLRITPKDSCHVGFTVQNSIDGTLAFSASGFTYRELCSNGVMFGYRKLAYYYHKHTKGLDVQRMGVKAAIQDVINDMYEVVNNYVKLTKLKLNREIAKQIAGARFISRKFLPDYIEVEKGKLVSFDSNVTQWQVYNDLTEAIWHNTRTNIDSKRAQFNILHRIIRV